MAAFSIRSSRGSVHTAGYNYMCKSEEICIFFSKVLGDFHWLIFCSSFPEASSHRMSFVPPAPSRPWHGYSEFCVEGKWNRRSWGRSDCCVIFVIFPNLQRKTHKNRITLHEQWFESLEENLSGWKKQMSHLIGSYNKHN